MLTTIGPMRLGRLTASLFLILPQGIGYESLRFGAGEALSAYVPGFPFCSADPIPKECA